MRVADEGDVRVYGVLSTGGPGCANLDNFSRTDVQRAFIEVLTGPTPTAEPEPCPATINGQGSCSIEQALATFCQAGLVVHDACAANEICGDDGAGNFRCIALAANPCGSVSRFGECDGQTLRWCDDDTVTERECVECAERCQRASPTQGFACVASDCGDLDETGICQGTLWRRCNRLGHAEEHDCADDGQTCQFVGPIQGNDCYDADACRGLTYQGACSGTVLAWCQDGEVLQGDCADSGAQCVFIDDDTGSICQ